MTYHRTKATSGSVFDYALGLELRDEIMNGSPTLQAGAFIANFDDDDSNSSNPLLEMIVTGDEEVIKEISAHFGGDFDLEVLPLRNNYDFSVRWLFDSGTKKLSAN